MWQRRARLASLKIQGYDTAQLWRALLLESAIVLGVGCAVGAVAGIYGHALASRWLRLATGFPAPFEVGLLRVLLTLALLAFIALAVIALPGPRGGSRARSNKSSGVTMYRCSGRRNCSGGCSDRQSARLRRRVCGSSCQILARGVPARRARATSLA